MLALRTKLRLSSTAVRCFSASDKKTIDFGFETVDYEKKQEKVAGVFSSVADSYDVMNDAMSLGIHRYWKNTFVGSIGALKRRKIFNEKRDLIDEVPLKCLDVAGGTGDISFRILEKAKADQPYGSKCVLI